MRTLVIDIDDCKSKPDLLGLVDQLARTIDPNDSMSELLTEIIKFYFKTRTYKVLSYLAHHAFISILKAVGKFGPGYMP